MRSSESIKSLMTALAKAQGEFPAIEKDKANPHFRSKYATLEGVIDTLKPTLDKNNLIIIQPPTSDIAGHTGVTTLLYHLESGELLEETLLLPSNGPGREADAQSATAAVTYARRTSYLGMVGVVPEGEDDDGNRAAAPAKAQNKAKSAPKAAPKNAPPAGPPPPKAEFPKDAPVTPSTTQASQAKTASAPSTMKESEKADVHSKLRSLCETLAEAGLKDAPGAPIRRKVLNYLLRTLAAENIEAIGQKQFDMFFELVDKKIATNVQELVQLVDATS